MWRARVGAHDLSCHRQSDRSAPPNKQLGLEFSFHPVALLAQCRRRNPQPLRCGKQASFGNQGNEVSEITEFHSA
jgi:hypothetical protein